MRLVVCAALAIILWGIASAKAVAQEAVQGIDRGPLGFKIGTLDEENGCITGQLVEFTNDHGSDRRICSPSLGIPRDMYVYLPPHYTPQAAYPLLLWLHGFGGDERQFVCQVVKVLDEAILAGEMPPIVAACPDGSIPCKPTRPWKTGSWFINSRQGRWEDYIVADVLGFLERSFRLRPERDARIVAGWSMGGFAAFNLGMKHPSLFGTLVGVYPNLNLRYVDCHGRGRTDFDPRCWDWLESLHGHHLVGFYPRYRIPIPAAVVFFPVWGRGRAAAARMSCENPIEQLDRLDIQPGRFDMVIAYGGKDEYNVDAQVESFLFRAAQKCLPVRVHFDPEGHHSTRYVNRCLPDVFRDLGNRLRDRLPE